MPTGSFIPSLIDLQGKSNKNFIILYLTIILQIWSKGSIPPFTGDDFTLQKGKVS